MAKFNSPGHATQEVRSALRRLNSPGVEGSALVQEMQSSQDIMNALVGSMIEAVVDWGGDEPKTLIKGLLSEKPVIVHGDLGVIDYSMVVDGTEEVIGSEKDGEDFGEESGLIQLFLGKSVFSVIELPQDSE